MKLKLNKIGYFFNRFCVLVPLYSNLLNTQFYSNSRSV